MTLFYPATLLLHIVGVIGLFIALSLEVAVVSRLRVAKTTTQVHEWLTLSRVIDLVLPVSAVLILISGLVLTFSAWGWGHAWIALSLGLLVLLGILGPVINGPRMKAIQVAAQAAPVGEIPPALRKAISNPVLPMAYAPIPALGALGAVIMMVLKLDWLGSGMVIALVLIVGFVIALVRKGESIHFVKEPLSKIVAEKHREKERLSARKEKEPMTTILPKEQLQNGYLFQGKDYGGIPISFFWMQLPPDEGPKLHYHPYDEIFIVLEGCATFTVGESTVEVEAGNVVIGPANVPHKFSKAGSESLRIVTIHPSPKTIGTRVED